MASAPESAYRDLPSLDRLLGDARVASLIEQHGRDSVVALARTVLAEYRNAVTEHGRAPLPPRWPTRLWLAR